MNRPYARYMELINTLGLNGWLLLWQVVLFFVLLAILKRFAYGPLLSALEERQARIAQGLDDAAKAADDRAQASTEAERLRVDAAREAQRMLDEARTSAERLRVESLEKTRTDADRLVSDGQAQVAADRAAMMHDVEADVTELVRDASERVLSRTLTGSDHDRLIAEAVTTATAERTV